MNSQFGSPAAVAAARKSDNEVPEFKMDGVMVRGTAVTQAAIESTTDSQGDWKFRNTSTAQSTWSLSSPRKAMVLDLSFIWPTAGLGGCSTQPTPDSTTPSLWTHAAHDSRTVSIVGPGHRSPPHMDSTAHTDLPPSLERVLTTNRALW